MIPDQMDRDKIIEEPGNILVSASAGSGKTTIMIEKIKNVLEAIENHKMIAAITFTIKAAQEIRDKAERNKVQSSFVSSTNDAFIENEIIRPFIVDAFGDEFSADYSVEYENAYKFNKGLAGLNQLKEKKVLGSYWNSNTNFNFKIALRVLKMSRSAREYLQSKYEMIFIDEYQDCDMDMHNLFMYFSEELNLRTFIVGDEKQAIYIWRGAQRDIFNQIPSSYTKYKLVKNFRCHDEIINYANLLYEPDIFNSDLSSPVNHVVHFEYNDIKNDFQQLVQQNILDPSKEITILANLNKDAAYFAQQLQDIGYDFVFIPRTPLDEGTPNARILKELGKYVKNNRYSVYDLIVQTNLDEETINNRYLKNILKQLRIELADSETTDALQICCDYLKIPLTEVEKENFYKTIRNPDFDIVFQDNKMKLQVMTVFGSKGLEFDQVISFSDYYAIHRNNDTQNHYVCVTRAKEKFIMFIDDGGNYEEFINNKIAKKQIEEHKLIYNKIENPSEC